MQKSVFEDELNVTPQLLPNTGLQHTQKHGIRLRREAAFVSAQYNLEFCFQHPYTVQSVFYQCLDCIVHVKSAVDEECMTNVATVGKSLRMVVVQYHYLQIQMENI